jgi:hypothetical protein
LGAHEREIGELARVVGENLQQPWHLIKLFHVGNFANIPLHDGSYVIPRPWLASLLVLHAEAFRGSRQSARLY